MRIRMLISCIYSLAAMNIFAQSADVQGNTGPYLGQKTPGMVPGVFAPGIISTEGVQAKLSITPDGSELIFMTMNLTQGKDNSPPQRQIRFISIRKRDGYWQEPEEIPFSRSYTNDEPFLSHDGKTLFFVSDRPLSGYGAEVRMPDIWFVERREDGWSEPQNVGQPVNTEGVEVQPYYSADKKLFFGRPDGLYYSQYSRGKFTEPVKLDEPIFQGRIRGLCISPDNTLLVAHSDKPGGFGGWDLYFSRIDKQGNWTALVNMGSAINTGLSEANATFSPDGKYLFFSRGDDIYWVSTKIFNELMSKEQKKNNDAKNQDK